MIALVEGWISLLEVGGDDRYPAWELAAWLYAASMVLENVAPELARAAYDAQREWAERAA